MSKNITLMGANYPDVPAVVLPQTGGGSATFTDTSGTTATQGDVLSGKSFFNAFGELQQGSLIVHDVKSKTKTYSTNTNGVAVIPTTDISLPNNILVAVTNSLGYFCSFSVIASTPTQYKVKVWDTSGNTFQVISEQQVSLTLYYIDLS